MNAWIDENGYLHIQGEKSIEVYALKVWCEQSPQADELPDNLIVHLILPEVREGVDVQLEKTKCCGSCKWWSYFVEEGEIETYCAAQGYYGMDSSYGCDKWEVRE